jgi:hypothetical protein
MPFNWRKIDEDIEHGPRLEFFEFPPVVTRVTVGRTFQTVVAGDGLVDGLTTHCDPDEPEIRGRIPLKSHTTDKISLSSLETINSLSLSNPLCDILLILLLTQKPSELNAHDLALVAHMVRPVDYVAFIGPGASDPYFWKTNFIPIGKILLCYGPDADRLLRTHNAAGFLTFGREQSAEIHRSFPPLAFRLDKSVLSKRLAQRRRDFGLEALGEGDFGVVADGGDGGYDFRRVSAERPKGLGVSLGARLARPGGMVYGCGRGPTSLVGVRLYSKDRLLEDKGGMVSGDKRKARIRLGISFKPASKHLRTDHPPRRLGKVH